MPPPTTLPTVDVVVTYHESPETIGRVLDALSKQDQPLGRIVVVDNGSSAGIGPFEGQQEQLVLVRLTENVGPSRARNIGLAETTAEWVFFVDDDIYPDAQCVSRLTSLAVETSAAVVCPRIVLPPDGSRIQCDGAWIHFTGTLILQNRDALTRERPPGRHVCGAFGSGCILVRREILAEAGGFDEDFFFQFEDMELSYRLRALGHTFWCNSGAVAFHDLGQGTVGLSFRGRGAYPAQRVYYTLRHRWLTLLYHLRLRSALILAPALALYETAAFLECARRGWLSTWWRALSSLLKRPRLILDKRRRWQAGRQIGDRQILVGGSLPFAAGFVSTKGTARAVGILNALLDAYWNLVKRWL